MSSSSNNNHHPTPIDPTIPPASDPAIVTPTAAEAAAAAAVVAAAEAVTAAAEAAAAKFTNVYQAHAPSTAAATAGATTSPTPAVPGSSPSSSPASLSQPDQDPVPPAAAATSASGPPPAQVSAGASAPSPTPTLAAPTPTPAVVTFAPAPRDDPEYGRIPPTTPRHTGPPRDVGTPSTPVTPAGLGAMNLNDPAQRLMVEGKRVGLPRYLKERKEMKENHHTKVDPMKQALESKKEKFYKRFQALEMGCDSVDRATGYMKSQCDKLSVFLSTTTGVEQALAKLQDNQHRGMEATTKLDAAVEKHAAATTQLEEKKNSVNTAKAAQAIDQATHNGLVNDAKNAVVQKQSELDQEDNDIEQKRQAMEKAFQEYNNALQNRKTTAQAHSNLVEAHVQAMENQATSAQAHQSTVDSAVEQQTLAEEELATTAKAVTDTVTELNDVMKEREEIANECQGATQAQAASFDQIVQAFPVMHAQLEEVGNSRSELLPHAKEMIDDMVDKALALGKKIGRYRRNMEINSENIQEGKKSDKELSMQEAKDAAAAASG